MNPVLGEYVDLQEWPEPRARRMVDGLRVLQEIATRGKNPVTYKEFAAAVQPKLAPLATAAILEDIGVFCQEFEWPNLTCFVVSASTGEPSDGFTKSSSEDPAKARDRAWFRYRVYKDAPLVDEA